MQSWWVILVSIVCAALLHLVVAFFVLRGLETTFGLPAQTNTARRALISLVPILPVAGALGLPFLLFPLVAPFVGTIASAIMVGQKHAVSQGRGAKIIIAVVVLVYILSAALIYDWRGGLLNFQPG